MCIAAIPGGGYWERNPSSDQYQRIEITKCQGFRGFRIGLSSLIIQNLLICCCFLFSLSPPPPPLPRLREFQIKALHPLQSPPHPSTPLVIEHNIVDPPSPICHPPLLACLPPLGDRHHAPTISCCEPDLRVRGSIPGVMNCSPTR